MFNLICTHTIQDKQTNLGFAPQAYHAAKHGDLGEICTRLGNLLLPTIGVPGCASLLQLRPARNRQLVYSPAGVGLSHTGLDVLRYHCMSTWTIRIANHKYTVA